ncbi:MAG: hypothetical protein HY908_32150 [Myxococcales bacterium]|nr:hypothetical protein [Myxococcales bacterium]
MSHPLLETPAVDRLARYLEEATRAGARSEQPFVEPGRDTLARTRARRHHLVFGRRGSGKTTLLRKAGADLALERVPTAFVDLEAFKGHSYPDVLLGVLVETFGALRRWLESAAVHLASRVSFWRRLTGKRPQKPPLDKKRSAALAADLDAATGELVRMLHAEEGAQLTEKRTTTKTKARKLTGGLTVGAKLPPVELGATSGGERTEQQGTAVEVSEVVRRNKTGFLARHLLDYQQLLERVVALAGADAYLFLDDLYLLGRAEQPRVLDYLHRLVKGRSVWLKVGTIRNRSTWYRPGDPPLGMKLGDDCDDIDLDVTLAKFRLARAFLGRIADELAERARLASHETVLSPGGAERLVLASGGVARDFLTLWRRAIDAGRERGADHRGVRVTATDVMAAALEHDPSKRDELVRDAAEAQAPLERALAAIQRHCQSSGANCLLVAEDGSEDARRMAALVRELCDLRFVHLVGGRVTVRQLPGQRFLPYMLDVSQLPAPTRKGEKRPRLVRFWQKAELARLRHPRHVLADGALGAEAPTDERP